MARSFFINGETMVSVKGNINTTISSSTQLGLADGPITVTPDFRHRDINVDAWGNTEIPADVQVFLASVGVRITLIHFDRAVLDTVLAESLGGMNGAVGQMPRAGTLMGGNGLARFAAGNHYIGLNLSSPVGNKPWRFFYSYLTGPPVEFPLGTEKSVAVVNFRVIPYAADPWGGGTGALGALLWDYNSDS